MGHKKTTDALALAELCGWEDFVDIAARDMVVFLKCSLGHALNHRLSDVDAHRDAAAVVEHGPQSLVAAVLGSFMAAARRAPESEAAIAVLDSTEARRAALGGALEDDGRFVALLALKGPVSDWWVHDASRAKFSIHGLEWELALESPDAPAGPVRVGLRLLGGSRKKQVTYEIGLVNLDDQRPDFAVRCKEVLSSAASAWTVLALPNLRNIGEGWRASGCVAPYVRILEVADAAPPAQ